MTPLAKNGRSAHGWGILLALVFISIFSAANAADSSYRILVTNDDGIGSPFLAALSDALRQSPDFEIVVVAPDGNRSGASQSSTRRPLSVTAYRRDGEVFGQAVSGTPADAVAFGLVEMGRDRPFDLVVSGINRGANVGSVSHNSGTVGAAMQALMLGTPAVAVSQDRQADTALAARFTARIVEKLRAHGLPDGTMLSINVPRGPLKGVVAAPMGGSFLGRSYRLERDEEEHKMYEADVHYVTVDETGTDTAYYQAGYVTVTPLRFDWTDHVVLDALADWNLRLPETASEPVP